MDLKHAFLVLWKHRLWVAVPFVAIVAGTAAYTMSLEPVYQANARLLLEQKDKTLSAIGPQMGEFGELSSVSRSSNPIDTQVELVKSGHIIEKVVEKINLKNPETGEPLTTRQFLASGRVKNLKGTDVIQLSFEHTDRELAQQVVTAWAAEFMRENRASNKRDASKAAKFLSGQVDKVKVELAQAEVSLRNFQQANGTIDLSQEARVAVQDASDLDAHVREARAAANSASSRVSALRSRLGISASDALAASAVNQDPTARNLREQLVAAETNPLLTTAGPNHPDAIQLRRQIVTLKRALDARTRALMGRAYRGNGIAENLDPIRQGLARELVDAEVSALAASTRLESLRRLSGSVDQKVASLPGKQLQLTRLSRRVGVLNEQYRMLVQKLEEARLQEALNAGNVSMVENAAVPETPVRPNRLFNMMLAIAGGLGLGVGLAAFREYLDDTLKTLDQAEKTLSLPVLGVIPWLPRAGAAKLIALTHPRSPTAESYRTLRTNLKFLGNDAVRMLTATSAGPGEGKSTTMTNLAITVAQTGRRVLIVDGDMRKPTVHAIFEKSNEVGFSSVLAGKARFEDAVQRGPLPNLDLLTSGPIPPDPAELLESRRFDELLASLRERYDLVFFDAPPIIAVTDASIMASRMDGMILMVGMNRVSQRAARHALKLLDAAKVKVWGMVLRGMRPDHDPYYQSYYHAYYGQVEKNQQRQNRRVWPFRRAG